MAQAFIPAAVVAQLGVCVSRDAMMDRITKSPERVIQRREFHFFTSLGLG